MNPLLKLKQRLCVWVTFYCLLYESDTLRMIFVNFIMQTTQSKNDFISLLATQLLSARILNQNSFIYLYFFIYFGLYVSVTRNFSRKVS